MTWFKVDDSFHGHPKVAELEAGKHFAEAIALWTLAGSWCAQHLTDGFVPSAQLRRLVPFNPAKAAAELVRVGLWTLVEGGFQFHGWAEYQPTKQRVEAERAASAGRLARWREKNRGSAVRDADVTPLQTPREAASPTLAPTRPDPTRPDHTSSTCVSRAGKPLDPEHVRDEYLARWVKVSSAQPPLVARGPGGAVWLELAREAGDAASLERLLDAAFADSFVAETGWMPNAIRGAAQRLLTAGARSPRGAAKPATHQQHAADAAEKGVVIDGF